MKTAIIYASKNGTTKKIAKALSNKIKGEVATIPIAKAKDACLLKYDFIVFGGSIHYGHIQGDLKGFVNKNSKTIEGLNYGLFITCLNKEQEKEYLNKSFGEEIVNSALITACFGTELNPNKGDLISKFMTKSALKKIKKENKEAPSIDWELVDEFANTINEKIKK